MISATVHDLPSAPPIEPCQPQPAPALVARLEQLRRTLRPTPHVPLAMEGVNLFAKLEYVNPVGSIKDRPAFWILKRAAERGEISENTTVIESSSGNFASALAAFTRLVGLRFIPVIDPNVSSTYESFLRRICDTVVKVDERDDTGGFLKTRLQMVEHRPDAGVAGADRRRHPDSRARDGGGVPRAPRDARPVRGRLQRDGLRGGQAVCAEDGPVAKRQAPRGPVRVR